MRHNSTHFPVPPYLPFTLAVSSPKENYKMKILIKNKAKQTHVSPPSSPPLHHFLIHLRRWELWCRHTQGPFIQTALLANVHCHELAFWFKASGFWNTIITGSCCYPSHGDPLALVPHDQFLHALQQVIDGVEWANSKHWMGPWVVAELVSASLH